MARIGETSLTIQHRESGEILTIQLDPAHRSIFRFRRACAGLDRIIVKQNLTLYFLTLTVRDENIDAMNRDLNKFLNWARNRFRRANLIWAYVWVVELQKRRYKKYGTKALHWHFAIGCPDRALPHSEKRNGRMRLVEDGIVISVQDIRKYWGKGDIIFSVRAWSSRVYGYLEKYFDKDYSQLGEYNPEWANLRRFGSSQLSYFGWAKWGYEWAERQLLENPELGEMYIRKVGSKVGFYAKDEKGKFNALSETRSPWQLVATENPEGDKIEIEEGAVAITAE